jgi:hypothetical protein
MHAPNKPTSVTVEGTVVDGKLQLDEPLQVAGSTRVRVTIEPVDMPVDIGPNEPDPLATFFGSGKGGPVDGAAQHDHYIYGWPKK